MRKNGSRRWLAGIDLGVTHYRIGIVEAATGKIHQLTKLKTAGFTLQQFCDALAKVARPYRKDLVGIGVAIPGFPDRAQRRVLTTCGTVPFLESCDVAEAVEERLNVQTWVDNDARAHAVGEFQYGGWGKPRSLVVMTLGTGVGLAWHVEGRLYPPPDHGAQGGHMSAFPTTGNPCFCGVSGCLESLPAGRRSRRPPTNAWRGSTLLNFVLLRMLSRSAAWARRTPWRRNVSRELSRRCGARCTRFIISTFRMCWYWAEAPHSACGAHMVITNSTAWCRSRSKFIDK